MKQIEPNPWTQIEKKYPTGTRVEGVVKNVTDFGIFIEIEDGVDGLVHVSDFSWKEKVENPADRYKKGDKVEAVVLKIDQENERFSLGIKQLPDDPWQKINAGFRPRSHAKGKVLRVEADGIILDLGSDIQGYMAKKDLDGYIPEKNEEIEAEVINIDDKERRVVLSLKAYHRSTEKQALEDFRSKQGESTATLSDVLNKE